MKKIVTLTLLLISLLISAKELPSWGMTEKQFKLPNFTTKMHEIGDKAVKNNWLLKITAPQDWHNEIRSGLSREGENNVQINFKDSLYKSITMSATPGMDLKINHSDSTQTATVKKQVVIEKPEMDTDIEAPEFDGSEFNNTKELMDEIGQLELTLPNGQTLNKDNGDRDNQKAAQKTSPQPVKSTAQQSKPVVKKQTAAVVSKQEQKEADEESLRLRYARNKSVDDLISYDHITDDDDIYVEGKAVLVKRFVNRGVAVYFWMAEDYDPQLHNFESKGSGKYQKVGSAKPKKVVVKKPQVDLQKSANTPDTAAKGASAFDFVAVTDQNDVQDQLRRDFIRSKAVLNNIKASHLKSDDVLYVDEQTILVVRPVGNTRSIYFWLEGETNISQELEHTGPKEYTLK